MWDRWKEVSVPNISSIHLVVSIQYRLVTDGHTITANIELAYRRAEKKKLVAYCTKAFSDKFQRVFCAANDLSSLKMSLLSYVLNADRPIRRCVS